MQQQQKFWRYQSEELKALPWRKEATLTSKIGEWLLIWNLEKIAALAALAALSLILLETFHAN